MSKRYQTHPRPYHPPATIKAAPQTAPVVTAPAPRIILSPVQLEMLSLLVMREINTMTCMAAVSDLHRKRRDAWQKTLNTLIGMQQ